MRERIHDLAAEPLIRVQQLLPGFEVNDDTDFASFYAPEPLAMVKTCLQQWLDNNQTDFIYLSGASSTGKSHLLQAIAYTVLEKGLRSVYLPLSELLLHNTPSVLARMATLDCVCIDELDVLSGRVDWQEALFALFNQRLDANLPLCFAATMPATLVAIELGDLKSRLASCLSFQLPILADEEKIRMLQFRAARRGMDINASCAEYILQHSARSSEALVEVLDTLDQQSLLAGRKITVPFLKSVFGW